MSKHISPTAQLLRSSRLFSIPPPLPRPILDQPASLGFKNSDTATLPYPIRQAIETPSSSRFRGDWGLKRALPKRGTRASNPTLRITALDTIERITDYESATDHARSLEKFQEMRLALSRDEVRDRVSFDEVAKDAFMAEVNDTGKGISEIDKERLGWQFDGPNVDAAAMTDGEFEKLVTGIRQRKGDFHRFLRKELHEQLINERGKDAHDVHRYRTESHLLTRSRFYSWLKDMSPKQFQAKLRLYQEQSTTSPEFSSWLDTLTEDAIKTRQQMYRLMRTTAVENGLTSAAEFPTYLSQLPPSELHQQWMSPNDSENSKPPPTLSGFALYLESRLGEEVTLEQWRETLAEAAKEEREFMSTYDSDFETYVADHIRALRGDSTTQSKLNNHIRKFLDMRPINHVSASDAKIAAPESADISTHPSAGLSYLRTNAVIENHPILGPQERRTPIEARVLVPIDLDYRAQPQPVLGVAGFVTIPPADTSQGSYSQGWSSDKTIKQLQLNVPGGGKTWVQTKSAHIDWTGRLRLKVEKVPNNSSVLIRRGKFTNPKQPLPSFSRPGGSPNRFSNSFDSSSKSSYSRGTLADGINQMAKKPSTPHPTIQTLNNLLKPYPPP